MKKAVILLITVLTATLAFSSCNKKSSVSVNGVPVSEGVYNYYYDIEKIPMRTSRSKRFPTPRCPMSQPMLL